MTDVLKTANHNWDSTETNNRLLSKECLLEIEILLFTQYEMHSFDMDIHQIF